MSIYQAPIDDIRFCLESMSDLQAIASLPGYEDFSDDLIEPILDQANRFASEVLAPLNRVGDQEKANFDNGKVTLPKGFKDAYEQFIAAGWNNIGLPREVGGQGLPCILATAVAEIFMAANKAFTMCPGLTQGAIEALMANADEALKSIYLPGMVEGRWSGTMNLTEPQAGSDLSLLRASAQPSTDGRYLVTGQKIFISFGEHDLTENIIHLVLARLPDAPEGVRGISLFLVPKFLLDESGQPSKRNDVRCVSIEHKMGINASPTCIMAYGDEGGAVGYLVGAPNKGLQAMFVMMNHARLTVGLEGLAVAERAYQQARAYARERTQGKDASGQTVAIIQHPDVRRMLMTMKAQIEAMRAMATSIAAAIDIAHGSNDRESQQAQQLYVDLMTPIFKAWATETGVEMASLGVQIHGGMGYVEETGAAQHLRDARISPIYEGTTGIQANDLMSRKLMRDQGQAFFSLLQQMTQTVEQLEAVPDLLDLGKALNKSVTGLQETVRFVLEEFPRSPQAMLAVSVPFLMLSGGTMGAWLLAKQALLANARIQAGDRHPYLAAKIATSRFYLLNLLATYQGLKETVIHGGEAVLALDPSLY